MTEIFNNDSAFLDAAFGDMENSTKMQSDLLFVKKGETYSLAMLPPLMYDGKEKLSVAVETEYQGTPGKQHIVRFLNIATSNKVIDWENSRYVGIPLPASIVAQLAAAYKAEYSMCVNPSTIIVLTKNPKTAIQLLPKSKEIPTELWEGHTALTWESLIEAHVNMQSNMKAKETKTEEAPW